MFQELDNDELCFSLRIIFGIDKGYFDELLFLPDKNV